MRIIILSTFILLSFHALAQDSRVVGVESNARITVRYTPEQIQAIREALLEHPYTKYYDRLIVEYEKRMRANVRKHKVMARKMQKPQYSDPMYFGHKHKPKKRPVGKRKFCKECGIVH